jgi:hypothetical protein
MKEPSTVLVVAVLVVQFEASAMRAAHSAGVPLVNAAKLNSA